MRHRNPCGRAGTNDWPIHSSPCAVTICLRLFVHWVRRPASRAALIAGNQQPDQNTDNGNDHEKLDEREPVAAGRDA